MLRCEAAPQRSKTPEFAEVPLDFLLHGELPDGEIVGLSRIAAMAGYGLRVLPMRSLWSACTALTCLLLLALGFLAWLSRHGIAAH